MNYFLLVLVTIVIVASVVPMPLAEGEEFGVIKRSVKQVKTTFNCGYKLVKNGFGIFKDFVTLDWY